MECNRDEAFRAKEIAEKKFIENDIAGAKKFAQKAQNLFPSLDGISQLILTLDVYLSSDARFNGEKDWYGILSVNPSADDETVKKQYRKLALQLHPDKNKSMGAEGAFQLISEAWSVLSDRSKRTLYDHKRFGKAFQQKTTIVKKDHPAPNTTNGFCTKSNNAHAPKVRVKKSHTGTAPTPCGTKPPSFQQSKPETFWTSCERCKMQYEYLKLYLNLTLLCPNCRQAFVASEKAAPTKAPNHFASQSSFQQTHQNSNIHSTTKTGHGTSTFHNVGSSGVMHGVGPNINISSNFQWGPFSRTAGVASASASSTAAAQAANVVHNTYEKVRREREEAHAAARREESIQKVGLKRNSFCPDNLNAGLGENEYNKNAKMRRGIIDEPRVNYGREAGNVGMYNENFFNYSVNSRKVVIRRGFPQAHVLTTLMAKSKEDIRKKVEAWSSERAAKSAENENARKKQKAKENVKEKLKEANTGIAVDQHRVYDLNSNSKKAPLPINLANTGDADPDKEMMEPVNIDVPDADFHDFDKDRTEKSFKCDEIWASYDDEDGMPRYYALVQKVISYKPFKIRMSFLTSKSNSEFGPLNWVSSGFAKTSGDFRVGRYVVNDTLNVFSHKVKWEKGLRGVIKIVPKQGDVWALYRNWSPDWSVNTPDDVIYKYDMVEVLEDYNEEQGVKVAPLVKVAGFKTVFHQHLDPNKAKRIPREEMFRFSHQVPSYVLTGEEGSNAPKGCYELDPAATPLELLQVVTESRDDEVIQAADLQQATNG